MGDGFVWGTILLARKELACRGFFLLTRPSPWYYRTYRFRGKRSRGPAEGLEAFLEAEIISKLPKCPCLARERKENVRNNGR